LSIEVATLVNTDTSYVTMVPPTALISVMTVTLATKLKVAGKYANHQIVLIGTIDLGSGPVPWGPLTISPSLITKLKVSALPVCGVGDSGSITVPAPITATITTSGQPIPPKLKSA